MSAFIGRMGSTIARHPLRVVLIGVLAFAGLMLLAAVECYVWDWHPLG